jgi:chloride channel protein, CIC family
MAQREDPHGWRARWQRALGWLDFVFARRLGAASREDQLFLLLIVLTGVVAGFLGIAVHAVIGLLEDLLWGSGASLAERAAALPSWRVIAAPAAGGVLVGLLLLVFHSVNRAGGMSALIEAVALAGGRVPGRAVLLDAVTAIATVGAGGSLGREGPMIRLGSMLSSRMGTRFHLAPHRVKVLVGCGAAAGLAAVYNIPVGGALFAMEVILGNFALEIFGPIVVSSVISTLIARAFTGDLARLEDAAGLTLVSSWEIPAFIGLGIVAAALSVLFVLGVRSGGLLFRKLTIVPRWLHPVIGMGLLGVLALWMPSVLGGGSDLIPRLVGGELPLTLLLLLPLAKIVATALTRGSGGAGGLFTPTLTFGALVGALYGTGLGMLFPGAVASPGAYAVVGMAAATAGTSHAPISAILILFEFTRDYDLILPLMLASITATVVSRWLYPYSVYTESLERRGVDLSARMGEAVLAGLSVTDLVRADAETLRPATPYGEVVEAFLTTHRQRLFVLGPDGGLSGAVSLHDIKGTLDRPELLTAVVAHDLAAPVERYVRLDDRLSSAVEAFSASPFERLPVLDADGKFRGLLSKRDVLAVYAQEVLGRPALLATFVGQGSRDYVELPPDFAVRKVPVPAALAGKTLADAALPQTAGVRVLAVQRGDERLIPEAGTLLTTGDELIALGPTDALERLEAGE